MSVTDDHVADLADVVAGLRAAGLTVGAVLDDIGVITGTVDRSALGGLAAVAGVAEVEARREVQLPPPDTPVQ